MLVLPAFPVFKLHLDFPAIEGRSVRCTVLRTELFLAPVGFNNRRGVDVSAIHPIEAISVTV
jgi:hypothetical protein